MRTLIAGLLLLAPAGLAGPPALGALQPGGVRQIEQTLDVNIVFVGYEAGTGARDINHAAFTAGLPAAYRSINRYPSYYGATQWTGLRFNFNYNIVYAPAAYEDSFFSFLSGIAAPQPLSAYQQAYNAQTAKALVVAGNHWIDPVAVEKYLAANPPAGVDTRKYTVFFINWYGRAGFKHHVYVKQNEPDPETGYNFGLSRQSRKMIAWGGTSVDDPQDGMGALGVRRIWFHDLSAGPEYWTGNWNVMTGDIDGDGVTDYRMPPVWEYGSAKPGLYRAFNNLSADLGLITRYVAIDLLFTASPLYKPAISAPKLPEKVQLDINVFQGESGVDGKAYFNPPLIATNLNRLQPWNQFSVQLNDAVFTSKARDAYMGFATGKSTYGKRLFGIGFGDLFLFSLDHLMQYIDGDPDYEVPVFNYSIPAALDTGGLLGFSDDNWSDGTQSFVFTFMSPVIRSLGYGSTTTTIHEVGHHLGMSHPHDGYDWEANVDFGASGPYYFANAGDESSSMMSYIDLNWDFSQFDRDNMARYMTILYINQANAILGSIYASPRGGQADAKALSADLDATAALALYGLMKYEEAAARAQSAYKKVLEGAALAGVKVETEAWQADYKAKGKSPKFVDPLDAHRNAP